MGTHYFIRYYFKDDAGVMALVEYKTYDGYDYYESKRSKYNLENAIYKYADEILNSRTYSLD